MLKKMDIKHSVMSDPAIYRIRVQGELETKWSTLLEDMNITAIEGFQWRNGIHSGGTTGRSGGTFGRPELAV